MTAVSGFLNGLMRVVKRSAGFDAAASSPARWREGDSRWLPWNAGGTVPASVIERSRHAYKNDGYYRNGCDALATALAGSGWGFAPKDAGLLPGWTIYAANAVWGGGAFDGLTSNVMRDMVVSGEGLVVIQPDGTLHQLPRDVIDSAFSADPGNGRVIREGVEFQDGREVAIHVRLDGAIVPERVEKSRYLRVYRKDFPGQVRGVPWGAWEPTALVTRAMATTSDFPLLMNDAGNRVLLASYRAAESPLKRLARQSNLPNFRDGKFLRAGGIPNLKEVTEAGEIKHVTTLEAGEGFKLKTYASIMSVSRQLIVNDDFGVFGQWATNAGIAAANTEAELLASLLLEGAGAGPLMSDGKRLFHVDHGNLGTAAAPDVDELSAARLAMRRQTALDGTSLINATPKFFVVSPRRHGRDVCARHSADRSC